MLLDLMVVIKLLVVVVLVVVIVIRVHRTGRRIYTQVRLLVLTAYVIRVLEVFVELVGVDLVVINLFTVSHHHLRLAGIFFHGLVGVNERRLRLLAEGVLNGSCNRVQTHEM